MAKRKKQYGRPVSALVPESTFLIFKAFRLRYGASPTIIAGLLLLDRLGSEAREAIIDEANAIRKPEKTETLSQTETQSANAG